MKTDTSDNFVEVFYSKRMQYARIVHPTGRAELLVNKGSTEDVVTWRRALKKWRFRLNVSSDLIRGSMYKYDQSECVFVGCGVETKDLEGKHWISEGGEINFSPDENVVHLLIHPSDRNGEGGGK